MGRRTGPAAPRARIVTEISFGASSSCFADGIRHNFESGISRTVGVDQRQDRPCHSGGTWLIWAARVLAPIGGNEVVHLVLIGAHHIDGRTIHANAAAVHPDRPRTQLHDLVGDVGDE